MPDAPAYTTVPGKLADLLKKIRETGVPPKASKAWLQTLGYKSSNDPSLLSVLRQIGFIDASNVPQPAWKEYRGADHKEVLGRAIRLGYADLYDTYPDAHDRTSTELGHVFSTKTDAGKQSIDKMVATFKNLAALAAFDTTPTGEPKIAAPAVSPPTPATSGAVIAQTSLKSGGLNVNINVELTLPETTDEKVYEAFFKAMRKHLLDDQS